MTQDEVIEMAKQVGFQTGIVSYMSGLGGYPFVKAIGTGEVLPNLERFAKLVAAKEREACAHKVEEFARKWWKIHCDSNLHYSSTLRAHQDFCALQAAIRARGEQA
jgi:hypothetical protein